MWSKPRAESNICKSEVKNNTKQTINHIVFVFCPEWRLPGRTTSARPLSKARHEANAAQSDGTNSTQVRLLDLLTKNYVSIFITS